MFGWIKSPFHSDPEPVHDQVHGNVPGDVPGADKVLDPVPDVQRFSRLCARYPNLAPRARSVAAMVRSRANW